MGVPDMAIGPLYYSAYDEASVRLTAEFEDAGKSAGIEVIDAEAIASTATDATTQLTHIKAANPTAVVVWTTLARSSCRSHR